MSDGLSYLGLRCVLEYLEANKRIHITTRSPVLQKFEKSIPLHLDRLLLNKPNIWLNNTAFNIDNFSRLYLTKSKGKKHKKVRIPEGVGMDEAVNTITHRFLDSRGDIYVKQLSIWESTELPANLQFKIRKLDTSSHSFRDGYLNVVHPSSYPLMELRTEIMSVEDLNHDVLKSAAKLVIYIDQVDETWFLPGLADLTNSEIVIGPMSPDKIRYFNIILTYLQTPRKIGDCLTFSLLYCKVFHDVMVLVKEQVNGKSVKIKNSVEGLTIHTPFAIPINSTSTALIYGFSKPHDGEFKVEIYSTDAFTSVNSN